MICERCGRAMKDEPVAIQGIQGPGSTVLVCGDCMQAVTRVVRRYRMIMEADEAAHTCAAHEGGAE